MEHTERLHTTPRMTLDYRQLGRRMVRASKLDAQLYEEVESDTGAMLQAVTIVILSSIAAGIGTFTTQGAQGILVNTVTALAGWFFWSFLTYLIGTKLTPEPWTSADYGQLLRTIGFASSPGVIRILGIIPVIGPGIFLIATVWTVVAMVIAVRQALDYSTTMRAVLVVVIGWVVQAVLLALILFLVRI
jgi:hypothetical protein